MYTLHSCNNLQSENTASAKTKLTVSPNSVFYSLKVIKLARKSEYTLHKFSAQKFSNLSSAKKYISKFLTGSVTTFGYIIPGHGVKGKQLVIKEDHDLETMYAIYFGKREIMLWCTGELNESTTTTPCRKRDRENEGNSSTCTSMPKSKTGKRMEEVDDIVDELKEKHKSQYSVEKLNAWAHMIHMGKHTSYESPPDLPYFGKHKQQNVLSETPAVVALSPGKRIHYRTECMDQLSKWHSLLEKGVVSEEQYSLLQASIMEDITKM